MKNQNQNQNTTTTTKGGTTMNQNTTTTNTTTTNTTTTKGGTTMMNQKQNNNQIANRTPQTRDYYQTAAFAKDCEKLNKAVRAVIAEQGQELKTREDVLRAAIDKLSESNGKQAREAVRIANEELYLFTLARQELSDLNEATVTRCDTLDEFLSLSGDVQRLIIVRMVRFRINQNQKRALLADGRIIALSRTQTKCDGVPVVEFKPLPHYDFIDRPFFNAQIDHVVNDAWVRLYDGEALDADGNPLPFGVRLSRAVDSAVQEIYRKEYANPKAMITLSARQAAKVGYAGNTSVKVVDLEAYEAKADHAWSQSSVIAWDWIDDLTNHPTDRKIVRAIIAGYNQTEIAKAHHMDKATVSRRVDLIKARIIIDRLNARTDGETVGDIQLSVRNAKKALGAAIMYCISFGMTYDRIADAMCCDVEAVRKALRA